MLTLVNPPSLLPVSLSQIKAHLRLDHCDEDDYLLHLNAVATQLIQVYLGCSLIKQTWKLLWQQPVMPAESLSKQFVKPARIPLKFSPILTLKEINLLKEGGKKEVIDRYFLNLSTLIPYLEVSSLFQKVEVIYDAGFGERPIDVPAPIHQAIIATITEFYEVRENVTVPANSYIQGLLQPYRKIRLL